MTTALKTPLLLGAGVLYAMLETSAMTRAQAFFMANDRPTPNATNGLSLNGLSANGLSTNGLSANGLSANGLASQHLRLNAVALPSGERVELR